jgi:dUTPase
MKIPENNYGFLDTRSSTSKIKLDLLCRTIDEPYTGNIRLSLINLNQEPVTVKMGQCVAQIIIKPYTKVDPIPSPDLEDFLAVAGETTRGSDGFGSTGRNV